VGGKNRSDEYLGQITKGKEQGKALMFLEKNHV